MGLEESPEISGRGPTGIEGVNWWAIVGLLVVVFSAFTMIAFLVRALTSM